jgi:hypothetical protein
MTEELEEYLLQTAANMGLSFVGGQREAQAVLLRAARDRVESILIPELGADLARKTADIFAEAVIKIRNAVEAEGGSNKSEALQ